VLGILSQGKPKVNVAQQSAEKVRILVADDDPAILALYRDVLGRGGEKDPARSEMASLEADLFGEGGPEETRGGITSQFELTSCSQGEEAVEEVRRACDEERPFAMAFLDVRMPPGINGVQTAEKIRSLDSDVQIAIVTGYSDINPAEIERRVPPPDRLLYVQKPIHLFEISQFASTLAARWWAERQLRQVNRDLESIVDLRTAELRKTNEELKKEIAERLRAEEESRRLETQMLQAQKLESLGVLAGGIAHDFNNLLMTILGNADLALMDVEPISPVRNCIQEIASAGRRAAELSAQMLAYSGRGKFVIEPIDLSATVREMVNLLDISISKKVKPELQLAENLPQIRGDSTQIRQIVMNLVTNASEAIGGSEGTIHISTGTTTCDENYFSQADFDSPLPEGRYVFLEVTDTGCGMDEDVQTKIFDPFFTTKFTGRGLGMAAVLGIVRAHNGAIHVYSRPGRGTTFRVLFPQAEEAAAAAAPQPRETSDWHFDGTVLLAEDEEQVRSVAKRMLERMGLNVLTARDGREAVDLFQETADRVSLVLLDLTMPRMDGDQAMEEIHRIRPDVRAILASGYSEQETAKRFAEKGFCGFIQKPYTMDKLVAEMKRALGPH